MVHSPTTRGHHSTSRAVVLIVCSQDWDAPGRLPGVLARAGCKVEVLCPEHSALFHTGYAANRYEAPAEVDACVTAFHRLRRRRRYDWIIAADDPLLAVLEEGPPEQLRSWFPIDPARDGFEIVRGKTGFCRAAQRCGLSIPRSAVAHSLNQAAQAARDIGFPVVLKRDVSFAGTGVRLVESVEELEAAYGHIEDTRPCVVQEMIEGRVGNTAALFARGRPLAWMTAYKSRTWPGPFGPSSARQFVDRPELAAVLTRLGEYTGYHGFLALDWIERRSVTPGGAGDLAFIELNARPVPALQMAPLVGVDFAAAVPGLFGEAVPVQVPALRQGTATRVYPMFPQDFLRAIAKGEQQQLNAWASGAHPFEDIPWDDPSLIEFHMRSRFVRRHFNRVFPGRLP